VLGSPPAAQEGSAAAGFAGALDAWLRVNPVRDGQLYHDALAEFERPLIAHALAETGGNQLRAARLLGINRNTLRKRLTDLQLDPDAWTRRG
jgi:two-component system, NtrC family, nitrogen regulation response regulator GlnG